MTWGERIRGWFHRTGSEALGWTLIVMGLFMLVMPGPGLLAMLGGVALLARHYVWADRVFEPLEEKAIEAAKLANGVAVFPTFAPDEQVSLKLSDFNDLANKSTLGIEAVKRQVGSVIERIIRQNKEQMSQFRTDIAQPDMEGKKQKRALTQ